MSPATAHRPNCSRCCTTPPPCPQPAETPDQLVLHAARGPITAADWAATRIVEIVVHCDDLSRSVPSAAPVPLSREALATASRTLAEILAAQAPGHSVEVRVPPFIAVQAVAGPRHTSGTPANVVETDPLTWVRLATGRLTWAAAVAGGTVTASGVRADLSDYFPFCRNENRVARGTRWVLGRPTPVHSRRGTGRRQADPRPLSRRQAPAGRLRRLRGLGAGRRGRQARPISGSTRCSTAARRPPASRSATAPRCVVFKDLGLVVAGLRRGRRWTPCRATSPIGHTRYSTTGSTTWENAQPSFRTTSDRHRPRAGPQRQPGQHGRARCRGARAGRSSATAGIRSPRPTPTC